MSSGVGVSQDCLNVFNELKMSKKLAYVTFTLNKDNTEIVVAGKSESRDYADFLSELPEGECRWAVYDLEYNLGDGGKRNKLVFYHWSPDDAKIKQKMVFASSRDALRRSLVGIATEIQGTDYSEVDHETVIEKVKRTGH